MEDNFAQKLFKTLTPEQRADKEIRRFMVECMCRSLSGRWAQYINGNGIVELNCNDGTLITTVLDDSDFDAEFPLNMDMNISDKCNNGCKFCYAGCSPSGAEANIEEFVNSPFFESLHAGTELAINGNEPFHPSLEKLLWECMRKKIFVNITVRYNTFVKNRETLRQYQSAGFIHGIGVSVEENMDFDVFKSTRNDDINNIVFHTINGITSPKTFEDIKKFGGKVLILGYKTFGFGVQYSQAQAADIREKQAYVRGNLINWLNDVRKGAGFSVVSFDNLALEQLNVKECLSDEEWKSFFRGNDGHHTMYLDLVKKQFCRNSMTPAENRHELNLNSTSEETFKIIKEESLKEV